MKPLVLLILVVLEATASAAPTAEDLYTEGQTAYDHADYATAIMRWRAAFDLSGANDLLFNLAQAYRQSGDCRKALAAYRRFVASDEAPVSEQHALAEDLSRELALRCDEDRSAAAITEPPKLANGLNLTEGLSHHEHPEQTLRITGLMVGGAGAATLTIGLLLGYHAQTLAEEVTYACSISCDWSALQDKHAAGRRDATIGYTLDAVGTATIVAGAIMYYLGDHDDASKLALSPRPHEGAVISWSGSW